MAEQIEDSNSFKIELHSFLQTADTDLRYAQLLKVALVVWQDCPSKLPISVPPGLKINN